MVLSKTSLFLNYVTAGSLYCTFCICIQNSFPRQLLKSTYIQFCRAFCSKRYGKQNPIMLKSKQRRKCRQRRRHSPFFDAQNARHCTSVRKRLLRFCFVSKRSEKRTGFARRRLHDYLDASILPIHLLLMKLPAVAFLEIPEPPEEKVSD